MSLSPSDILGPTGRVAARLQNYEEAARTIGDGRSGPRGHRAAQAFDRRSRHRRRQKLCLSRSHHPGDRRQRGQRGTGAARRAVIATHTISLQEQLMSKDLPLLNAVIPLEFAAVLVKGRGNYLSLRRLKGAVSRANNLFREENDFAALDNLRHWAEETNDGSLGDLDHRPPTAVWDEVASDHGNCMGRQCPTYQQCFYYQARRRMQNAQILVVNHALFFSDLALRCAGASILPDYDMVIFDEAHNLEHVASEHLGLHLSSSQVQYALNKLYNDRTNRGLLVHHKLVDLQQEVLDCRYVADEFFQQVRFWGAEQGPKNGRVDQPEIVGDLLSRQLDRLAALVRRAGDNLSAAEERQDFASAADRLAGIASMVEAWHKQSLDRTVYWIDASQGRYPKTTLAAAPLDVGETLARAAVRSRSRPWS